MGGYRWMQNFIQMPLEKNYNDSMMQEIPYPYFELGIHVTMKTVQTGCFVGGWAIPAIVHCISQKEPFNKKVRRFGKYGFLIGLTAGPLLTVARVYQANIDREAAAERCYRIRYNKRQLFTDRLSVVFGLTGFYGSQFLGLCHCVNTAVVLTSIYNKFLWNIAIKKWHDMAEERPQQKTPQRKL